MAPVKLDSPVKVFVVSVEADSLGKSAKLKVKKIVWAARPRVLHEEALIKDRDLTSRTTSEIQLKRKVYYRFIEQV